jgi:hypothetical protein
LRSALIEQASALIFEGGRWHERGQGGEVAGTWLAVRIRNPGRTYRGHRNLPHRSARDLRLQRGRQGPSRSNAGFVEFGCSDPRRASWRQPRRSRAGSSTTADWGAGHRLAACTGGLSGREPSGGGPMDSSAHRSFCRCGGSGGRGVSGIGPRCDLATGGLPSGRRHQSRIWPKCCKKGDDVQHPRSS